MTKAEAGRLGGLACVRNNGRDYMSRLGLSGARATWRKYALKPNGAAGWLMIEKATGAVKAKIGEGWFPLPLSAYQQQEGDAACLE